MFEQGRDQSSAGGGNKMAGGEAGCEELGNDGEGLSRRSQGRGNERSRTGEQESEAMASR